MTVCRCEYCASVNRFIPEAELVASKKTKQWMKETYGELVKDTPERRKAKNLYWDKQFHSEMNKLTASANVRHLEYMEGYDEQ